MPSESTAQERAGLSRRQLLARGAVAAGVVWAAPVIRSTAAYATTNNGTEQPCHDFYLVSINPAGRCKSPGGNADGAGGVSGFDDLRAFHGRGGHLPPAIEQWLEDNPRVQVKFPAVCPQLTQTSDAAWALLLPEVTGPNAAGRQCRMVLGWGRKGNDYAEAYVDPNPPLASQAGRRLIFPRPDVTPDREGLTVDGTPSAPAPRTSATSSTTTTTTTTTAPPQVEKPRATDAFAAAEAEAAAELAPGSEPPTSTSTSTTTTTNAPPAAAAPVDELGGDGRSVDSEEELTGDGTPSTSTHGPGRTLDEAVLVFCCP